MARLRPVTRTYAIGDVHGCLGKLQRLVDLCMEDAGQQSNNLIFLGDYIDRGHDSRGVIEFLMALQDTRPNLVTCLMGNHEDMLLATADDSHWEERWLRNGGIETLKSYGVAHASRIPKPHLNWLQTLPKYHDDGQRFFVHAGIHPDRHLNQQDEHDLLWIREPFLSSGKDFGRLIVHGHTPLATGMPDIHSNRVNLDTAAVYGGPLTAARFSHRSPGPDLFLFAS